MRCYCFQHFYARTKILDHYIFVISISFIKLTKILQALFPYEVNDIGGTLSTASLIITTDWSAVFLFFHNSPGHCVEISGKGIKNTALCLVITLSPIPKSPAKPKTPV